MKLKAFNKQLKKEFNENYSEKALVEIKEKKYLDKINSSICSIRYTSYIWHSFRNRSACGKQL